MSVIPRFAIRLHMSVGIWLVIGIFGDPLRGEETVETFSASQPLSPEAAVQSMQLRSGFDIQLVAAEPLIEDPIAFDWGADGRLWVVEMRDYPNGLTWHGPDGPLHVPGGRVKVLSDHDKDGVYDQAELFLDELPYPTGIKVWRQGVLITAAPTIFYAEDRDSDGRADHREQWYSGFAESNQQHRINGLSWGLDGWLHIANGDGGGLIKTLGEDRDAVDIRGHDLRIHPQTRELRLLSGRTQCGRFRDDWGNWFGCNNSNPLWHFPLRYDALRRNPLLKTPSVVVSVPEVPGAAPVYPASKTATRFNQPDRANRFTSVCGPTIFRDDNWGADFAGNAFICEPVHNLVSRQILQKKGSTFSSRRAEDEKESEFLASTDPWSRPVAARTGPDGALWIADMYRLVIEHPEWIPMDLQRKIPLRAGSKLGRIYRIFPSDKKPSAVPQFDTLEQKNLVAALEDSNGTNRDLLSQMLIWEEKLNPSASEALHKILDQSDHALARLHAFAILNARNELSTERIKKTLQDPHPGVVKNAIRAAGFSLPESIRNFEDLQVAIEVAAQEDPIWLARVLIAHAGDKYVQTTALSSLTPQNIDAVVESLLTTQKNPDPSTWEQILSMAVHWEKELPISAALQFLQSRITPSSSTPNHLELSIFQGIGMIDRGRDFESKIPNETARFFIDSRIELVRELVNNDEAAPSLRRRALQVLSSPLYFDETRDFELLSKFLEAKALPMLRAAALEGFRAAKQPDTPELLLARWDRFPPQTRSGILTLLTSTPTWSAALLGAIEEGQIALLDIDASSRQRLQSSTDESIRDRSRNLFAQASSATRAEVIENYRQALSLKADAQSGKQHFRTLCIACHVAEGEGSEIGPDLAALTDRSAESMLVAIFDPNQAVEDKYMNYQITTKSGEQRFGLIAEEDANSIKLKVADGTSTSVSRSDIENVASIGVSLMPEGLEATLDHQATADIISYVASLGKSSAPDPALSGRTKPGKNGIIDLTAINSRISGDRIEYMADYDAIGWWNSEDDRVEWTVVLDRPGRYQAECEYSVSDKAAGNKWILQVDGKPVLKGVVKTTGSWERFVTIPLGELNLKAADNKIVVRSDGEIKGALLDLRSIRLTPIPKP